MRKADNLTTILCRCHEIWDLNFLQPSGPLQACNGTALPLLFIISVLMALLYSQHTFFFFALRPYVDHGLLIHEVSRSHTTTHHNRLDFSGRVTSSSQRPVPDNTQHSQQTNIHAPGGIRTHNLSRQAAANLRLRTRGHWDRPQPIITTYNWRVKNAICDTDAYYVAPWDVPCRKYV